MNKNLRHPDLGSVLAAKREGAVVRRALICRTGEFEGMNGPVSVTEDTLQGICDRYKSEKATPQNDNDFAPILIDHVRAATNVMGRVLAEGMELGPWESPDGDECIGLFGDLRVDDPEAQEFVSSGKFSQLSMSFDEETHELYEVSFVAVPAAKGSILLSKGGQMNTQRRLSLAQKKHNALAAAVKEQRSKRKAILSRMISTKSSLNKDVKELGRLISEGVTHLKEGQLKARFQEFVKQGRMEPVELEEMDFKTIASLAAPALDVVMKSYENRPPSDDGHTYGQTTEEISITPDLSPAAMRKAIELQRAGKPYVASLSTKAPGTLSEDDEEVDPDKDEGATIPKKSFAMSEDDYKKTMEHLSDCHEKLSACLEKIKGMGADADKLADADKDEEKKLGDDDDSADMGDDDEDKAKLGDDDEDDDKKKLADDEDAKDKKKLGKEDDKSADKKGAQ